MVFYQLIHLFSPYCHYFRIKHICVYLCASMGTWLRLPSEVKRCQILLEVKLQVSVRHWPQVQGAKFWPSSRAATPLNIFPFPNIIFDVLCTLAKLWTIVISIILVRGPPWKGGQLGRNQTNKFQLCISQVCQSHEYLLSDRLYWRTRLWMTSLQIGLKGYQEGTAFHGEGDVKELKPLKDLHACR